MFESTECFSTEIENGHFCEGRVWFDFHAVMTFTAWRLCFFVLFYSHCDLGQKLNTSDTKSIITYR